MRLDAIARRGFMIGLSLALAGGALAPRVHAGESVTVFAAASLKNALDDAAAAWQAGTGNEAVVSYGGSSALARQIEAGAPADLFISASTDWMDTLETGGHILADTRLDLLGNTLVLVATADAAQPVEISADLDLTGLLGDEKLAMALVDAVPAGVYGKAALTSLGLWESVAPKVAQVDDVRAALALVARGEAPFGIVYATDAVAEPRVTVIGAFPEGSHAPIIYPLAITRDSTSPVAQDFLDFLSSTEARPYFEAQGFSVLD